MSETKTHEKKDGLFGIIKKWTVEKLENNKDKIGIWLGSLAALIAILTPFFTFFFWIDSKVENEIEKKIAPYEHLLTGIALIKDDEYSRAVNEIEKALDILDIDDLDRSRKIAIIDHYLTAIVNSDEIDEHEPNFVDLNKMIEKIPLYGWHYHHLGWYYLRMGNIKKAQENLDKALSKYELEEIVREKSDTFWALAMLYLAEGNVDSAVKNTLKAAQLNPKEYSIKPIIDDAKAMKTDLWFKRLIKMYKKTFSPSFDLWVEELSVIMKEQ